MAKLLLLLVFVCFQFSSQEELTDVKIPNDGLTNEGFPAEKHEILDGEDENQWYKEKEDDKFEEEWTEDDEKWFQEIQDVLKGSDEDYDDDDDDDFEAIEKLIDDIEDFVGKAYPEKSKYQWLFDLEKWFGDDFYNDDDYALYPDIKKEENLDVEVDDKDNVDLYYSWLYKMKLRNSKTKRAQPLKRFWSV